MGLGLGWPGVFKWARNRIDCKLLLNGFVSSIVISIISKEGRKPRSIFMFLLILVLVTGSMMRL